VGRRSLTGRAADATLFCLVAIAVAAPWYLRAWYYTGNPLFPMFYDVLTGLGVDVARWDEGKEGGWQAAMERYGHGRSPIDLLLLPWRMTWHGGLYAGSLGPAWLLLLPLIPLFWRRIGRDLRILSALALVYLALWASPYSSFQLRYLVPLVPVLGVLAAAALRHLRPLLRRAGWRRAPAIVGGLVVAAMVLNLPPFFALKDAREWTPSIMRSVGPGAWLTVLGVRDADRYLVRRVRPYGAVLFMNEALPDDARVVTFAGAVHFYARPEVVHDYSRCVAHATWGYASGEEERAHAALREAGVTHILWDRERWRWDAGEPSDIAIDTEEFRARFVRTVYQDDRVWLDELIDPGTAAFSGSSGAPNP
jgi:hypothetical protein